jgi:hypothetical protein
MEGYSGPEKAQCMFWFNETLCNFVKDIMYVPPILNSVEELEIQISQAMLRVYE